MLQVGDQAAYTRTGQYGYRDWTTKVSTVSKVTPGGQVVLSDGKRFNKQGYEIGSSSEFRKCILIPVERAHEIHADHVKQVAQKNLVAQALQKVQQMDRRAGNLTDAEVALLESLVK